jgi:hypothetical protein
MKRLGTENFNFSRIAQAIKDKQETIDQVKILYVDGEKVREKEIEFALAGHHYRYPNIIPENEIWLEDTIKDREDMTEIMVHESVERLIMKFLEIDYNTAHEDFADLIEKKIRDYEQKN